VEVTAADNRELAWLGYEIGPPALIRDSVAVSGDTARLSRDLIVLPAWRGRSGVTAFARDLWGTLAQTQLDTITVVAAVRRPLVTLPLEAGVYDIGFDSKRNRLYLSEPLAQRIAVVQLPGGVYGPSIEMFGSPWGFDLTLSGDSLIVALRRTHLLGFVDLVNGSFDTLRLDLPNFLLTGPAGVRVMASGKALLAITCECVGFAYRMWEYQMATGAVQERAEMRPISETSPLIRSTDRERMLALMDNACCPVPAYVYESRSDSFTVYDTTVNRYFPPISTDATGSRFLIGNELFDQSLRRIEVLQVQGYTDGPTAIAPDGATAYFALDHSYARVTIPFGTPIEQVLMPLDAERFYVLPDGNTLAVTATDPRTSAQWLLLYDLR
jgi:hypothetical protein